MEFDRDKEHTLLGYVGDVDEFVTSETETNLYGMLELLLGLEVDDDYMRGLPGPSEYDLLIGKAISAYGRAKQPPAGVAFVGRGRDRRIMPTRQPVVTARAIARADAKLAPSRSVLRRLREWLRQNISSREIASEVVEVPITLASIHVPQVTGASCEFTDRASSTGQASYHVYIFGTGGGGKAEYTVDIARTHKASNGRCYNIKSTAEVRVTKVERTLFGKSSILLKSKCIRLRNGYTKSPIPTGDDQCGWSKQAIDVARLVHDVYDFDLKRAQDPDIVSLSLAVSIGAHVQYGVNIPALGLDTQAQIELASISEKSVEYTLPPAYEYTAYPVVDKFGYAWSWR